MDASLLVPGDIISIKLGDIIPADARLLEGDPLKIDQVSLVSQWKKKSILIWTLKCIRDYILQSALTGESLPVTKQPGDGIYSGSTCKQGEIEAVVIATGIHTFFGKAAHLVESTTHVGHFQKVSLQQPFYLISIDLDSLYFHWITWFTSILLLMSLVFHNDSSLHCVIYYFVAESVILVSFHGCLLGSHINRKLLYLLNCCWNDYWVNRDVRCSWKKIPSDCW